MEANERLHEPFCGSLARRVATLRPGGPGPVRIANPICDVVFKYLLDSRSDPHLLDILEEHFPIHHRAVLRRLMRAGAEQEVRDSMDVADDIMTAFQDQARESADLRQALVEKDQVIEGNYQALREKDQVIEEKERLIADLKMRLSGS